MQALSSLCTLLEAGQRTGTVCDWVNLQRRKGHVVSLTSGTIKDKALFARHRLWKHPPSKAMLCYFFTFRPQLLLRNQSSHRVRGKGVLGGLSPERWDLRTISGNPGRWQGPGTRPLYLIRYKIGSLYGFRRRAGKYKEEREGEAFLVCICDCTLKSKITQPFVHCPGVKSGIQPDATCFTSTPC